MDVDADGDADADADSGADVDADAVYIAAAAAAAADGCWLICIFPKAQCVAAAIRLPKSIKQSLDQDGSGR